MVVCSSSPAHAICLSTFQGMLDQARHGPGAVCSPSPAHAICLSTSQGMLDQARHGPGAVCSSSPAQAVCLSAHQGVVDHAQRGPGVVCRSSPAQALCPSIRGSSFKTCMIELSTGQGPVSLAHTRLVVLCERSDISAAMTDVGTKLGTACGVVAMCGTSPAGTACWSSGMTSCPRQPACPTRCQHVVKPGPSFLRKDGR